MISSETAGQTDINTCIVAELNNHVRTNPNYRKASLLKIMTLVVCPEPFKFILNYYFENQSLGSTVFSCIYKWM